MADHRPTSERTAASTAETVRLDPPPASATNPTAVNALAGRYDILGEIGAGGMGWVYRARDRETGEVVALKVLRTDLAADPGMAERFKNELRLARRVTHKNICRIYEFHRVDDVACISMEYIDGESLRARLGTAAPLALADAVDIVTQVCAGLNEAHTQGVIHRDLKPENIMIARSGVVKIMDFGIARSIASATVTTALLGTPAYMAPEQAHGKPVDERADIYAIGLVLYECLTGRRAFSGDTPLAVALKQVTEPPVAPRRIVGKIPVHVEALILRCLEKDPARRFSSVAHVESALRAGVPATPCAAPPRAISARRGRRTVAWLALSFAVAGLVALWYGSKVAVVPGVPSGAPQPTPASASREIGTTPAMAAAPTRSRTLPVDRDAALENLTAAAEAGGAHAQYRLGLMLLMGPPARRDEAQAFEWMQRAAQQDYIDAQFALGRMYERGKGVERSPVMARQWYERAAAGGHREAQEILEKFRQRSGPRR